MRFSIRGRAGAFALIAALMVGCGADDGGTAASAGGGASGAATSGSGGTDETCVNVSGDAPGDLQVSGSGFDAYEGERVHFAVVNSMGGGIGEATIASGAFALAMPGILTDYTSMAIYVDTNADNVCGLDEPFWEHTTGPFGGSIAFGVTPADWCEDAACGGWGGMVQAPCSVNGLLDLSEPQPCSN